VKVRVKRPGRHKHKPKPKRGVHPKMTIVAEGKDPFVVPYAPIGVTASALAAQFSTADRPGRAPLLLRSGNGLPQIAFDLVIGDPDPQVSIEPELRTLRNLAGSGKRMRVNLDPTTSKSLWRLTDFTQQIAGRQQGTNLPTRAVCSFTFQRASDTVVAVGPATGGKRDHPPKHPKFHIVQKGETLQSIANKFYGTPSAWHRIADANHLRRAKVAPGKRLKLP
jgi:nucleoid-associated protein YgaU